MDAPHDRSPQNQCVLVNPAYEEYAEKPVDTEETTSPATDDGSPAVKAPAADAEVHVSTRKQSYVQMMDGPKRVPSKEDVWDVTMDIEEEVEYKPWSEKTHLERFLAVSWIFARIILVLLAIYLFICSLSFLSASFQLLGGKSAGKAFSQSSIMTNPIVGLMMGVLVTVLVQSSSTSTSIIVAMIAAGIIALRPAINLIMGANIGTTVTNTIVSMGQAIDRKQFRRAFAGATVHDCFNWLAVAVFLPLEYFLHPIEELSKVIVSGIKTSHGDKHDFIKIITKPFTSKIIEINIKEVLAKVTKYCSHGTASYDKAECAKWQATTLIEQCFEEDTDKVVRCDFVFSETGMSDTWTGLILMVLSLLMLCLCLAALVKTLQSMLLGKVAANLKKYINSDLPYPFKWLTGYLFMGIGVILTFLLQSSSVFTSTLTPLVGLGVISLDRMFPLTLGSNIGTTTTAMLAALASNKDSRETTIQIAICHLLFNIFGIMLFYPVPFMRRIPIAGAKMLGNTTAKYRWFAVAYLLLVFFIIPSLLLGLSIINVHLFIAFIGCVLLLAAAIVALTLTQKYAKDRLPLKFQTWNFLPLPLHSLKPYDRLITACFSKCGKCGGKAVNPNELNGTVISYGNHNTKS